jgi:hypothetical protein
MGQHAICIKGGIYWGSLRDVQKYYNYYGNYSTCPSYSFGVDLKKRVANHINIGGSVEYYLSDLQWGANYGGVNKTAGKDIRYKFGFLRLTVFPEIRVGNKFQFYLNLGPFFSILVYSHKNGHTWDHSYSWKYIDETVTGSAKDDIKNIDAGIKGCAGFGYEVYRNVTVSVESDGYLGLVNLGDVKSAGISISAVLSYKFPKNK